MAILDSSDYPAVRAAIDTSLDANNLPDSVIGLPIFAAAADAWVLSRDPDAESYGPGAQADAIKRAAIYVCAALIIGSNPNITSETYTDGYRYNRKEYDPAARRAELLTLAEDAVKEAVGETPTDAVRGPRSFFARAAAYRGR